MTLKKEDILAEFHTFPILPLRDIIVFPHMVVPLFVGRKSSILALEEGVAIGDQILLVAQVNPDVDDPAEADLYSVGTVANILQFIKLADGTVKVLVEGVRRARIKSFNTDKSFLEAQTAPVKEEVHAGNKHIAMTRAVVARFEEYVRLNRRIPPEAMITISQTEDESKIADVIAAHLGVKNVDKQRLLEAGDIEYRMELLFSFLETEIGILCVEKKIRRRVKDQMDKNQREYYLNEQIKAIQTELGELDDLSELEDIKKKIDAIKLSPEAKEKAESELKKLKKMNLSSPEATVVRNYLDWLLSVPWGKKSKIKTDIKAAEKVLNHDHYGLDKVKERILEYLAVHKKTGKRKGPILCLVGPPGVGKTSLGQSIAKATGREFVRVSLGGMRDEAEIRGHRRTYIGSQPGKIIQGMKKAKTANPLFLLDEVDKIGADWRGDPSSALLEVLDPEQNNAFNDHYLEVDYDLSDVLFITTANTLDIPRPLMDRMEVIRLSGYTEDEKVEIAKHHLIPKQRTATGLLRKEWSISDDALRQLIRRYTAEAGVRNLEREIASLMRKAAKELMTEGEGKPDCIKVTRKNLEKYAGVPKYNFGIAGKEDLAGVVTGLAWTEVGGDILSIEALAMEGKGKITLTGHLGDVMKESIEAAWSYVRSHALQFGIRPSFFEKHDMHVHVPEGAVPKDGPSAGVAMFTALVSAITGIPVRKDVAMTGEITLIGRILPIGGLKEKLLAAMRGGIKTVIIPKDNEKDLAEIPENVKEALEIISFAKAEDVLKVALVKLPSPISPEQWEEEQAFLKEKHAAEAALSAKNVAPTPRQVH